MKLPRDRGDWCNRHLDTAIRERDAAFDHYERTVDFEHRERSDALFAAYLRKESIAEDVEHVVGSSRLTIRG